jgi:hypothetical protein
MPEQLTAVISSYPQSTSSWRTRELPSVATLVPPKALFHDLGLQYLGFIIACCNNDSGLILISATVLTVGKPMKYKAATLNSVCEGHPTGFSCCGLRIPSRSTEVFSQSLDQQITLRLWSPL